LDLLPTRGAKAFKLFVDALREDYEWLVDEIESAVNNPEPSDAIDSSKIENVRDTVWKNKNLLSAQFGNYKSFLFLRSFVKSILGVLEVKNLPL